MEPEKKSNGAFVGLVIIIIILVIGGIYILQSQKIGVIDEKYMKYPPQTQSETVTSQDAAALDALELDTQMTDTNTGVDANAVN